MPRPRSDSELPAARVWKIEVGAPLGPELRNVTLRLKRPTCPSSPILAIDFEQVWERVRDLPEEDQQLLGTDRYRPKNSIGAAEVEKYLAVSLADKGVAIGDKRGRRRHDAIRRDGSRRAATSNEDNDDQDPVHGRILEQNPASPTYRRQPRTSAAATRRYLVAAISRAARSPATLWISEAMSWGRQQPQHRHALRQPHVLLQPGHLQS